jgi:hypothetical protein
MIPPTSAFKIEKKRLYSKYNMSVELDMKDYDEKTLIETSTYLTIPGILQFFLPEFEDYCQIVINYNINLLKTDEMENIKNKKFIHYTADSLVIEKDYYSDDMDMGQLIKTLQGRIKYIKDPGILVNNMHNLLDKVDLIHFELIVSNMFRNADVPSQLCRHTGNYRNSTIIGQDKQALIDSWQSAISFQKIDQAISIGLVNGNDTEENPIERVLNEDYKSL